MDMALIGLPSESVVAGLISSLVESEMVTNRFTSLGADSARTYRGKLALAVSLLEDVKEFISHNQGSLNGNAFGGLTIEELIEEISGKRQYSVALLVHLTANIAVEVEARDEDEAYELAKEEFEGFGSYDQIDRLEDHEVDDVELIDVTEV